MKLGSKKKETDLVISILTYSVVFQNDLRKVAFPLLILNQTDGLTTYSIF